MNDYNRVDKDLLKKYCYHDVLASAELHKRFLDARPWFEKLLNYFGIYLIRYKK